MQGASNVSPRNRTESEQSIVTEMGRNGIRRSSTWDEMISEKIEDSGSEISDEVDGTVFCCLAGPRDSPFAII
jgi:hypothetical protein